MNFTALVLIVSGFIICAHPEIISYFIATLCIVIGLAMLSFTGILGRSQSRESFRVGGYEIFRSKKK